METINLKNLSIGYKHKSSVKVVAEGINASLHGGELTCLVGVNGIGKSTLLRTLSAFIPPVSGQVTLLQKPLESYTDKDLAKVIGVVLTDKLDVQNLSVDELVGLGRSPYTGFWGTLSDEDKTIVQESIDQVGIQKLQGRMVQTLSDGERQKVMIAKALAQQTPIIFLDEPTAFLDYPSKVELMLLLAKLAHTMGKTVFLSTHDLEIALQLADKVWLMEPNRLNIGTPQELQRDGSLQRAFGRQGITFTESEGTLRITINSAKTHLC